MTRPITRALLAAALIVSVPAYSAGANPAAPSKRVQSKQAPQPAALLVPAVQSAREVAPKQAPRTKSKGNVEYEWKVEKGE